MIEIFHNDLRTDEISIKIASQNTSEELLQTIKDHFRAKLRVAPTIEFSSIAEIDKLRFPPMSRKPVQLVDYRKMR